MLNIAALVKISLDPNMIRSIDDRVDVTNMQMAISEYDKNALEEAVRLKEKYGGKVVAFSALTWGPIDKKLKDSEIVQREILARGADELYVIVSNSLVNSSPLYTYQLLYEAIKKIGTFDLYVTGESSMDVGSSQIASRIASLLGLPVITYVRALEYDPKDNSIKAVRDLEDAYVTVEAKLPIVISVTGEINQARIPTLLQIRRAFSKPVKILTDKDLGFSSSTELLHKRNDLRIIKISRKNVILDGKTLDEIADKLISKLREEGVLKV